MTKTFSYTYQQVQGIDGPILFTINISGSTSQVQFYFKSTDVVPTFDVSKTPLENGMYPISGGSQVVVYPDMYLAFGSDIMDTGWKAGSVTVQIQNASDGNVVIDTITSTITINASLVTPNSINIDNAIGTGSSSNTTPVQISGTSLKVGLEASWTGANNRTSFEAAVSDDGVYANATITNLATSPTIIIVNPNQYIQFLYNGTAQDIVPVTIKNDSNGGTTLDTFSIYTFSDVRPDATSWTDIQHKSGGPWTYNTSQITGINVPIVIEVNYTFDGFNQLYYRKTAGPVTLNTSRPPTDALNGPMTAMSPLDKITVSNGEYISFGIDCSNFAYSNIYTVDVYNSTNNNEAIQSFLMESTL